MLLVKRVGGKRVDVVLNTPEDIMGNADALLEGMDVSVSKDAD